MTARRTAKKKGGGNKAKQAPAAVQKKEKVAPAVEPDSSSDSSLDEELVTQPKAVQASKKKSTKDQVDKSGDGSSSDGSASDSGSEESEDDADDQAEGFTDENAAWLKPKQKAALLDATDSEEEESEADDDDDDEMLDVEKEALMLDEEHDAERLEAEQDMRETIEQHTAIYHLPTQDEMQLDIDRVVPPSEMRSHVESILEVLAEFKDRREPGRSRQEYIQRLCDFLSELHGYLPELVEYFLTMFPPAETVEFINASDSPRPMVIRTNTLKARRKDLAAALIKRGVSLDPLANWSKVGLKIISSPVPVGATPEYLGGQYMLQSAASMCPVMALDPQPKETVLDMSAAPGGKTSYIAQLMRNTGIIFANDLKAERQRATIANMHRLGVKTVIACTHDGRVMGKKMFQNRFDRILLDAPCSGLGVISRDPSVKVQRTMADIKKCSHLQKELLLSAIDALKYKNTTGGFMVYSTCSVSVAENEEVVQYALSKRDIRIVDAGLDFGKSGFTRYQNRRFHPSIALTRRFYPHVHNMDGFFVCKIQKISNRTLDSKPMEADSVPDDEDGSSLVNESKKNKSDSNGKPVLAADEPVVDVKSLKRSHHSVPPKSIRPKNKKAKTNAKVTKPRRSKSHIQSM